MERPFDACSDSGCHKNIPDVTDGGFDRPLKVNRQTAKMATKTPVKRPNFALYREAKTEYLGAYNFFYPVSSGNLPYGPLATPEKAIREFSFLIYSPRGEILCKNPPLEGIFHQYFLKKVHFLKCTFYFLKTGGSWR